MSRQRIRASVLESTMQPCPHCGGTGHIRSDSSVALLVLRAIEEALLKDSRHHITVKTPYNTALYILNHKRRNLSDLETQFGLDITIEADDSVTAQHYIIVKGAVSERPAAPELTVIQPPALDDDDLDSEVEADEAEAETVEQPQPRHSHHDGEGDGEGQRKRRRRRRRRGGRGRGGDQGSHAGGGQEHEHRAEQAVEPAEDDGGGETPAETADAADDGDEAPRKRRRGKRGGRRNKDEAVEATSGEPAVETVAAEAGSDAVTAEAPAEPQEEEKPKRKRRTPAKKDKADAAAAESLENKDAEKPAEAADETEAKKPAKRKAPARKKAEKAASDPVISVVSDGQAVVPGPNPEAPAEDQDNQPRRSGWWQRKSFF
jgi:ribonuclease E